MTDDDDWGLMHRHHPLLGQRVVDHVHGDRHGILRAIAPDVDHPRHVAWIFPEGGGVEWTTNPDRIEASP
ncbi:hypothetical protein [Streptomyces sp. NPDC051993]|uniref:hypothetical protein n=1 Tax=Streptomyces sp. NPDC051993 TaxID=3155286 RepID=UPI003426C302